MMMNVIGLSLLVTSLAAAGILSPSPIADTQQIVKEGHRVVVVEYDKDGKQNTKISISPEQHHHDNVLDNAKDKIKEAASVLPNMGMGQGISHDLPPHPQDAAAFLHAPTELICDAFGKCKHKIATAMGKAKDKSQETLHNQKEAARDVGNTLSDAVGKAKETVYDKAHDVHEYARESVDKAKDTGQTVKDHVVRNVSEASDSVKDAVKRVASNLSTETLNPLMGVANLLGFATAYGMCVWVTFISSYVLSRAMPRQQFAVVQSKIYPVYFRAMAYSIGIALLGHVLSHRNRLFFSKAETLQAYNLLASLIAVFVNYVYLEPRATKLVFERMKIEKEEGRGREDMTPERNRTEEHQHTVDPKDTATAAASPTKGKEQNAVRSRIMKLNDKLKRMNSYSSLLNIMNLMSLTWHLVYLTQRVQRSC
ncbi:uncharacterized protein LOC133306545 [Gastrolobium bilobum]|uniref:uncharacterized protein LOC133306545 n=1 Tax=Gastrolobium bilobum TaxID=150636 RepID=UPI002AAF976E|nr:uncharacterized protein LOC133306545 [Gastrolobium bilobum]